jgi:F-type H+-transporting ATPase subunit gamma
MPSLKAIKTRIASVKNTQQITRAMKLVAAAKMKRAIDNALASRPYSDEVTAVLRSLLSRMGDADHPLLTPKAEVKRVAIVVVASDRGLCAGFNNNLARKVDRFSGDHAGPSGQWTEVEIVPYGRKMTDWAKRSQWTTGSGETDLHADKFADWTAKLIADLSARYSSEPGAENGLDEVYIAYNRYVNTLSQVPTIEKLFPLEGLTDGDIEEPEHLVEFVYEPDREGILGSILPLFLRTRVTQVFLESEAGEHAARMTAMDSATRNAKDVIDSLTIQYNRARQAAITKELIEIVAGAEAL